MKKRLLNSTTGLSVFSTAILIFFILIAYASLDYTVVTDLGNGVVQEDLNNIRSNIKRTTTGKRDEYGRWKGLITIQYIYSTGSYTEEAYMVNGKRQGLSTLHYNDGSTRTDYYVNDVKISLEKSASKVDPANPFEIMTSKYPWYQFSLNAAGFNDLYIQAYLLTLQGQLDDKTWDINNFDSQFDTYYQAAIDSLSKTTYDTIILAINKYAPVRGIDEMKNADFRMAAIDHYRKNQPTYQVIESGYGHYLAKINNDGYSNADFEQFCNDFDDSLATQGMLNVNGTLFTDSADEQMYFVLAPNIKSAADNFKNLQERQIALSTSKTTTDMRPFISQLSFQANNPTGQVVTDVYSYFLKGDMTKNILKETLRLNMGVSSLASVGIALDTIHSTSAEFTGYIFSNGGSDITSRGIVWSSSYNPDLTDNQIVFQTSPDVFSLTISGLTEGDTYFARTFATNSTGTVYSDCIQFVPITIVSRQQTEKPVMTVYPNPNSGSAIFSVWIEMPGNLSLNIYDMKGQLVMTRNLGILPQGQNKVGVDFHGIPDGVYNCILKDGFGEYRNRIVIER
ncbi:MAG TPA: T9SS type A sorting domain-containing protein [Bacteroidales bacterium]|nr:T9SS type A sorting domain-containing protein [Bacteroidales bacterium]